MRGRTAWFVSMAAAMGGSGTRGRHRYRVLVSDAEGRAPGVLDAELAEMKARRGVPASESANKAQERTQQAGDGPNPHATEQNNKAQAVATTGTKIYPANAKPISRPN